MFRHSDEPTPKYHDTYTNKPTPLLQLQAESALYDDMYSRRKDATIADKLPETIPTTFDHYYDPDNAKADWSGMVTTVSNEKKHEINHKSQLISLKHTEDGIVSINKDKYAYHKKRIGPVSTSDSRKNEGENIIGGILPVDQFKSTYTSLGESRTSSMRGDLDDHTISHKRIMAQNNAMVRQSQQTKNQTPPIVNEQVAFRYESQRVLGKSLLSNIGSTVVTKLPRDSNNNKLPL